MGQITFIAHGRIIGLLDLVFCTFVSNSTEYVTILVDQWSVYLSVSVCLSLSVSLSLKAKPEWNEAGQK